MDRTTIGWELREAAQLPERERRAKDRAQRELAASILEPCYPKVAAKVLAGMRSSTWTEDLVDPGLLLDLLEKIENSNSNPSNGKGVFDGR